MQKDKNYLIIKLIFPLFFLILLVFLLTVICCFYLEKISISNKQTFQFLMLDYLYTEIGFVITNSLHL